MTTRTRTETGSVRSAGCDLYYELIGDGAPILMIHPSGASAATWGSVTEELARSARVIVYDRRGYGRSGGQPVRSVRRHAADAVALLASLRMPPAVVVGTSAGAAIAVAVAVHRPDLVRAVISHEFPWRMTRHPPTASQLGAFARMGSLLMRRRQADAVEVLLRAAYAYRVGGSAWDAFPEDWRRVGRKHAKAALLDFLASIGNHPSGQELATISVPVVCTYGSRSPRFMARLTRSLATAIPTATIRVIDGAAHAAPFDATTEFVRPIQEMIGSPSEGGSGSESHMRGDA